MRRKTKSEKLLEGGAGGSWGPGKIKPRRRKKFTKKELAEAKATAGMKGKSGRKSLVRKGLEKAKSTTGRDVLLAGAGGAAAVYAATKSESKMSPAIKSRVSIKASPKPKKKAVRVKKAYTGPMIKGTNWVDSSQWKNK